VRFSFSIPNCTERLNQPAAFAGPDRLVELARTAERLGLYALWANDHLAPWPKLGAAGGDPPNWYEAIVTMACCASATTRIRIGFGVIVVPYREPVLLAKQVATLDAFSNGRVLLGVGIGAVRDEFRTLRPRERKPDRGGRLDEPRAALVRLFNEREASFAGRHYAFEKLSLCPRPVQEPLPIYLAGAVPATLKRVARFGAGLMVARSSPDELSAWIAELGVALEEVGRELREIDVVSCPVLRLDATREAAAKRALDSHIGRRFTGAGDPAEVERLLATQLVGTPQDVAERIAAQAEAGVTHCAPPHVVAETFDEMMEQMHRYAEDVIPLCRSL